MPPLSQQVYPGETRHTRVSFHGPESDCHTVYAEKERSYASLSLPGLLDDDAYRHARGGRGDAAGRPPPCRATASDGLGPRSDRGVHAPREPRDDLASRRGLPEDTVRARVCSKHLFDRTWRPMGAPTATSRTTVLLMCIFMLILLCARNHVLSTSVREVGGG